VKHSLRRIGGIYHLLAKQGAYSDLQFFDGDRTVKRVEQNLRRSS
jgi:hypothetical protein